MTTEERKPLGTGIPLAESWSAVLSTAGEKIKEHFDESRRLRLALPDGGTLYLERRLPFLTLYRRPTDRSDAGTNRLVTSQAAYLIAPRAAEAHRPLVQLIRSICQLAQPAFGAFLILEIWTRPESHPPLIESPTGPRPAFRLFSAARNETSVAVMDVLEKELKYTRVEGQRGEVVQVRRPRLYPDRARPVFTNAAADLLNCTQIGIEVEPIFQRGKDGVYPDLLKYLQRRLSHTLQHGFFHFVEHRTKLRPKNFHSLGRRAMVKSVWAADAELDRISGNCDFLMEIAPVNVDAVWNGFRKSRYESLPPLRYNTISIDPAIQKRALFAIPIERIEDPTVAHLFYQKQAELDRQLTMLSDRGTSRFLLGSRQLYGEILPPLVRAAETILEKIPPYLRERHGTRKISAEGFIKRAQEEIAYYRKKWPEIAPTVELRDNLLAGLMVSKGRLLVSTRTAAPANAVDALIQHEVGTHLVTYYNGGAQKLAQLRSGLAGYEQLQEGLAVLAEYLVGGLTPGRMRTLAARVLAAKAVIDGAGFIDCFRLLARYGFSRRAAFSITVRVFRGGGLTKDYIYLRGLNDVLRYLRDDGDITLLFVGKISTGSLPMLFELRSRGLILPPKMLPRYLDMPESQEKLKALRQGIAVHELLAFDEEEL